MEIDELPRHSLHQILAFLTINDLRSVLFVSKALKLLVLEYLNEQPTQILRGDSIRMSHTRMLDLLKTSKFHSKLELCCFNIKLTKTFGYFGTQLQVLKLMWLDEQYVFTASFWRNILYHKDSLVKLSIRMVRLEKGKSLDTGLMEDLDRVTESSMTLFFNEMHHLQKFSYKLSNTEDMHLFDFAAYTANDMICHSRVLLGLLQSNTQLKRLTLRNMILFEIAPTRVIENTCIESIRIEYENEPSELVLPHNTMRLRFTNQTFLFILHHFKALNKITIKDWSTIDNKYLCSECVNALNLHCNRLNQPIQLNLNSYSWHWQLSKIDLFQLCHIRLQGNCLNLRSLYALDADAMNLLATTKAWNVDGLDLSYTNINDQCLDVIQAVFSHIKILGISGCKKLSKESLVNCLSNLENLKEFSAEQTPSFTNISLSILLQKCSKSLQILKFKKNKINGDNIADCLIRCLHLKCLTLRNMNSTHDDFHFRWINILHSEKFHSNVMLELDISNNKRFDRKYIKKIKMLFPCLITLKIIYTIDIIETQQLVHPTVQYLSAIIDVIKAKKYKEVCLTTFPNLLILNTELKKQTRKSMQTLRPDDNQRRLMIYDFDGEAFVV